MRAVWFKKDKKILYQIVVMSQLHKKMKKKKRIGFLAFMDLEIT